MVWELANENMEAEIEEEEGRQRGSGAVKFPFVLYRPYGDDVWH
jgi:hypothetical protein